MKKLANAWRKRPIITTAFALAVLFTFFFAVRSVVFVVYWSDPSRTDQAIQGWMTPRYVAQSWHLPPEVMNKALGQDHMPKMRQTLSNIASEMDVTVEELAKRINDAAVEFRGRN